jgi:O-antigen ligase
VDGGVVVKRVSFGGAMFAITTLAFAACGVKYLNVVFNTDTRWIFVIVLWVILILRGQQFFLFTTRFGPAIGMYFLWCIVTSLWSLVPLLSFMKSLALIVISVGLVTAGQVWVQDWKRKDAYGYLLPIVLMTLFAGLISPSTGNIENGSGLTIYQGLTGNPNYLGVLVAISLPYALLNSYRTFRDNSAPWIKIVFIALNVALLALLLRSGSRAALLCALITLLVFFWTLNQSRQVGVVIAAVAIVGGVFLIVPEVNEGVYQRVVVKNASGDDIFFSRRETWQRSSEAAWQGGVVGLGYGVSAGATNFDWSLSSNTYGREKGNTVLAVMEETGVIGLTIYAVAILSIFFELYKGSRRTSDPMRRMELNIMTGFLAGILVHSMFEAWWSSPGSIEASLFWSSVGVATGLAHRNAQVAETEPTPVISLPSPLAPRAVRALRD